MSVGEQISLFDRDGWFGKMSAEFFPQTEVRTFEQSSRKRQELPIVIPQFLDLRTGSPGLILGVFWQTDGLSLGGYIPQSFGVAPKGVIESHLWQILEDKPHPKYCLSEKACQGILNRANKRGKELPTLLREALEQSVSKKEQDVTGGVKESSSNMTERGPCKRTASNASAKIYGISPFESNAMKSKNPDSGIYEADTSRTLDISGGNPACNQGGMMVVEPIAFSQDAYDKYSETDASAALKSSGGNYGGGTETLIKQSELYVQEITKE